MTSDRVMFVQQYAPILKGPRGEPFIARAYMRRPRGSLWEAWLVFLSLRTGKILETARETTQGKRAHILYWASGLEPTYLQGALERALRRRAEVKSGRPGTALERRAWRALVQASVDAAFRRVRIDASRRRARRSRRRIRIARSSSVSDPRPEPRAWTAAVSRSTVPA
jgi:hypothetical protein